jgi:diguanylate cyclase (GGDEF)-like protein
MFPARLTPSPGRLVALALVGALIAWTLLCVQTGDGSSVAPLRPAAAVGESAGAATADLESPSDAVSVAGPVELARPGLPAGSTVLAADASGAARPAEHPSAKDRRSGPVRSGLHPGDTVFWAGAFVADGAVRSDALCDIAGPCFEYPLEVRSGGARLRVAIDTPSREDTFRVDVVDPSGAVAASTSNGNQFNAEAFVVAPVAGSWSVRVVPTAVEDATFRMRAKLESVVPVAPGGRVALLPNLQVVPPYEFGFAAPVTPNGSYPPDAANPPASAAGHDLYSCTQDEAAPVEAGGAGAVDCLRLTSGPMNVGPGPFDMRFTFIDDLLDALRWAEELEEVAYRDPLTGLSNRRAWQDAMRREQARCARHPRPVAVVVIDLDDLKRVNDADGHLAGDVLLRMTGGLLREILRPSDIVARIGGDEFAALLVDVVDDDPGALADRIRRDLAVEGVAASVGAAIHPAGDRLDAAFQDADRSMYRQKAADRGHR